jgi:hypothetical protein
MPGLRYGWFCGRWIHVGKDACGSRGSVPISTAVTAVPMRDRLLKAIIFHGELLKGLTFVIRAFPSEFRVFPGTQALALLLIGHLGPRSRRVSSEG